MPGEGIREKDYRTDARRAAVLFIWLESNYITGMMSSETWHMLPC